MSNNIYPYPIKAALKHVIPHAALSTYQLDSVFAASLFKCVFKNAFQNVAVQEYSDALLQTARFHLLQKRYSKMEECFQRFVQYATSQIAKQHPQWTRRQLLDEVNEAVITIIDEFIDLVRRQALLYDGDEADDPYVVYAPMYQTVATIERLNTNTNFKRYSKMWLNRRETRRVRTGISVLKKSARNTAMSRVLNDPYLSHKISNMALRKSLSPSEEQRVDTEILDALPHLR
jgi:hypothetical protein